MSIDSLFSEKLHHFQKEPPKGVWKKIYEEINPNGSPILPIESPIFNGAETLFLRYFGGLAAMIAFGLGSISFQSNTSIEPSYKIAYSQPETYPNIPESSRNKSENSNITISQSQIHLRDQHHPIPSNTEHQSVVSMSKDEIEIIKSIRAERKLEREISQINDRLAILSRVPSAPILIPKTNPIAELLSATERNHENLLSVKPIETPTVNAIAPSNLALNKVIPANNRISEEKIDLGLSTQTNLWTKGIYIAPYIASNYTHIHYISEPNNPFYSEKANFTGRVGYNAGVQLGYQFSKHWSLESGLGYGQYIQSFNETKNRIERAGIMYIDQLDIPLMARYSIFFGKETPKHSLAVKGGLIYNSVLNYQVNYADRDLISFTDIKSNIDANKNLYNSLQIGYLMGLDFDLLLSRKVSLNFGLLHSVVSQLENFPIFHGDEHRPIQNSTSLSIGTKIRF